MAGVSRGLGRGLDALLGGGPRKGGGEEGDVRNVALDDIRPNAFQPRHDFSPESLEELAESIRGQGVLQPVLVRPMDGEGGGFELVAGERRLRAARLAGLSAVPALVRRMDDAQSLAVALIENLQREDLNPIEEAFGYKRLQDEFGVSQEALASRMGKSRPAIANALRLLSLPDAVKELIESADISAGHGRALMAVDDQAVQMELLGRIRKFGLSVRQAEAEAAFWKKNGTLPTAVEQEEDRKQSGARARNPRPPLEQDLLDVQERLSRELGLKVIITGTSEKGRISVHYSGVEELRRVAEILEQES